MGLFNAVLDTINAGLDAINEFAPSKIDVERKNFNSNGMPYVVDENFTLHDHHISSKNKKYSYEDVKSIHLTRSKSSVNFVRYTDFFYFHTVFDNNDSIIYCDDKCYFKSEAVERYQVAFEHVCRRTFKTRTNKIINEILKVGYVVIPKTEVKIFGNGLMAQEGKEINLKDCRWGIGIRTSGVKHHSTNPDAVIIESFTPHGKLNQTIRFDLSYDRDCYISILKWLFEPDNVIQ